MAICLCLLFKIIRFLTIQIVKVSFVLEWNTYRQLPPWASPALPRRGQPVPRYISHSQPLEPTTTTAFSFQSQSKGTATITISTFSFQSQSKVTITTAFSFQPQSKGTTITTATAFSFQSQSKGTTIIIAKTFSSQSQFKGTTKQQLSLSSHSPKVPQ